MSTIRTLLVATLLFITVPLMGQPYAEHSALATGEWYKLTINNTGIHKLAPSDMAQLLGKSIDQIAIYGLKGGMLSEHNALNTDDDLKRFPVKIIDNNGDGIFDADDYLLFYAEAADKWSVNAASQRFEHQQNAYAKANYCFIKIGNTQPLNIPTSEAMPRTGREITEYTYRTVHDIDLTNTHASGQKWVGERFDISTNSHTFTFTQPSSSTTGRVTIKYGVAKVGDGQAQFKFSWSGGQQNITLSSSQNYATDIAYTQGIGNTFSLTVACNSSGSSTVGYLDFIEINAILPLQFMGGQLDFRALHSSSDTLKRYIINNATANLQVWDVTDPANVSQQRLSIENGTAWFSVIENTQREYIAFDGSQYYKPTNISRVQNQDIHGMPTPTLTIVTNKSYLMQAQRLASLHEIVDSMNVLVIEDEKIYNEFSSGRQDPMAIRQMMRMFRYKASQNGQPAPRYLLLFGKGTYDNRNILGSQQPTVVTYVSPSSFSSEADSYCSDDFFAYLDDNESGLTYESLDLGVGRLPAKDSSEARHLVDKIEQYMLRYDLSSGNQTSHWRNVVTLLADDADPGSRGDTIFVSSSEYLAGQISSTYPQYNIDKIYADAFRQQTGAVGSYYPDVNNALKQRMDEGCLLINYIGHGSPMYIGTERFMERGDIENYANKNSLALFVTSTCSFGHYDMVDSVCSGEVFLISDGGGIGVISAGRPITHSQRFNTDVCMSALNPANRIGDALRIAKNNTPVSHCINLLGDPALRLSLPRNKVVVTNINGREVDGTFDTCNVLSQITVEGEIQREDGTLYSDFDGSVHTIIYDRATTSKTLANDNDGCEVSFTQQKNILFKGVIVVNNGKFRYNFVVPKDVPYHYGVGKLSHYAYSVDADDATGAYTQILFGGYNDSTDIAVCRPQLKLFINDTNFSQGGITDENPTLLAIVHDSLGVNAVGSGLGHDMTAIIDDRYNETIVLNDFYSTDLSQENTGYIQYKYSNLPAGKHKITVKVWNIFNYSSSATIEFEVRSSDTTNIANMQAYPTPAHEKVLIRADINTQATIKEAKINIYDLKGALIRTLHVPQAGQSYVVGPVQWDFQSNNGQVAPPGVYFAQLIITTTENETILSSTKVVKQ